MDAELEERSVDDVALTEDVIVSQWREVRGFCQRATPDA